MPLYKRFFMLTEITPYAGVGYVDPVPVGAFWKVVPVASVVVAGVV